MKILHIIQRYPPSIGGSETWCKGICRYSVEQGHCVTVLTLNVYKEEEFWHEPPLENCILRFGRLEYDGKVKVVRCKRTKIHPFVFYIFKVIDMLCKVYFYGPHSLEMYIKMFKETKDADIIHLNTLPYPHNIIGYLIAKIWGKKVVITPHFHPGNAHFEKMINYWLMKKCDAVFAVTNYEKEYLIEKGLNKDRVFIAHNAINPDEYKPKGFDNFKKEIFEKYNIKEGTKIIIFIGRKIEYKGIETLTEAVRILRKEISIKLFLVGPNFPCFSEYYSKLPEEEKKDIIDLGVVSHQVKVNLLCLSNLLVLPSKFEAFGIVFLEAWACNVPVIGSDIGALPKIIEKGGLVFRHGDVKDLEEKIRLLLINQNLSKEMARCGKEKTLREYAYNKVGNKVLNTYYLLRKNRLKFLIVSNLFPPSFLGGAEIVAYEQAKEIKALGHDVHIFCGKINGGIRQHKVINEKNIFNITRINLQSEDLDIFNRNYYNELIQRVFRNKLISFSPDIVHFHNLAGFPLGLIDECDKLKIPMVMTLHDYWPICIKKTMLRDNVDEICLADDFTCSNCKFPFSLEERNKIVREKFEKITHFICPSQYLANILVKGGFPAQKISVIKNGINLSRFKNIYKTDRNNHILRFGYLGYLDAHKGIEYLLRAFSLIKNRDKLILDLVISGYSKDYLDHFKVICRKLKIDRNINFIYKIDNRKIQKIYKKLDILILPSIWPENQPVSITEAMACGIPVLASDIGGISELVSHRKTGLLSPPKDIHNLAKNMEYLIFNPEEIKKMGENGFSKIKNFDLKNQTRLLINKYKELIGFY